MSPAEWGKLDPDAPLLPPVPIATTKRGNFLLAELYQAGSEGLTKISFPGVNVGDAVLKLRRAGVDIETVHEQHGGEFAGHHGRYVLRSKVVRLSVLDHNAAHRYQPAAPGTQAGGA